MIGKTSRYVNGRLDTEDNTVSVTRIFPDPRLVKFRYVTWTSAMRLDLLAARTFGHPDEWWRIMDLNPFVQSPTDLRPGMQIRVPDV